MTDIFPPLQDSLAKKVYGPIAKHRQNMAPIPGEKRFLKKRSIIETMIGKFENFFGETFSRFLSPQSAFRKGCKFYCKKW
jgi:hypothetical protein